MLTFLVKTPKVGAYNLDYYNIYTPIKKYNEEPKDLRDLKPGFNTGAKRFKPTKELPPVNIHLTQIINFQPHLTRELTF